jgi:hypothetical protein
MQDKSFLYDVDNKGTVSRWRGKISGRQLDVEVVIYAVFILLLIT